MIPNGVHWYSGITGCGKTVLAHDIHLRELVSHTRTPALITNFACKNFLHIPHVQSVDAAWVSLYEQRQHTYFRPRSVSEFESLLKGTKRAAEKGFKIHYFFDEVSTYANSNYTSPELQDLINNWRHYTLTIQCTTQYFGNINAKVYSACSPHLWIFRSTGEYVGKILERRYAKYGVTAARMETLPQFEYVHVYEGFDNVT